MYATCLCAGMSFAALFVELKKRYGLKSQHIDILNLLQHEDLAADEISRRTQIPLGRLYHFLNELLDYGLADKSGRKPFQYSMQPPQEKILLFMQRQFDAAVRSQSEIMGLLEQKGRVNHLEMIESSERFSYHMLQMLNEGKYFKTITRQTSFPFSLYSHEKKDFLAIRESIGRRRQTLAYHTPEIASIMFNTITEFHRKRRPYLEIVCKEALDSHLAFIKEEFGEDMHRRILDGITNKIKNYNFNAFVLKEFTPMQIFITDKRVLFSLIHQGKTTGVVIRSSDVVHLYEHLFSSMLARAVPIGEYLRLSVVGGR